MPPTAEAEAAAPKRAPDDEFKAMDKIVKALLAMDEDTRRRVLAYINARFSTGGGQ